jgi:hypothetical protein
MRLSPNTFRPLHQPAPHFGLLLKISSSNPATAMAYGQEVLEKLANPQSTSTPTAGPITLISANNSLLLPDALSNTIAALGLESNADLDPTVPHGFPDPDHSSNYFIVANTEGTRPHGSLYSTLANALRAIGIRGNIKADQQTKSLHQIQRNFTERPDYTIEI